MSNGDLEEIIVKRVKAFVEKNIYPEADAWEAKDIFDKFNEIVGDFYDDYHPDFYSRRGSMYLILDLKYDALNGVTFEFDPSMMTFRSGYGGENGLYDLTFRRGWHGGAKKDGSGDPRYRVPQFVTEDGEAVYTKYSSWGITASRFDPPPLEQLGTWYAEYIDKSERFYEVVEEYSYDLEMIVADAKAEYAQKRLK